MTGFIPSYANTRLYLRILDGENRSVFGEMKHGIDQHRGTPQNPTDWSDPDRWIPERLEGASRRLALKIWIESNRAINPAHLKGFVSISFRHSMFSRKGAKITLTREAVRFLNSDDDFIMQMDRYEGMFHILSDLEDKGAGRNLDILGRYEHYCLAYTGWQSSVSIVSSQRQRLQNLANRGYVDKGANSYRISTAGRRYLKRASEADSIEPKGL